MSEPRYDTAMDRYGQRCGAFRVGDRVSCKLGTQKLSGIVHGKGLPGFYWVLLCGLSDNYHVPEEAIKHSSW